MSDKYLKSLTFPDLADRYVVGDSSLSVSGAAADAKTTGDALATKAEVDGAYESMTVGNAEQLVGTTFEEDSVPYNFRTSGGSIDIGDREYDELVGGTVAWNQLVQTRNGLSQTQAYYGMLPNDTVSFVNGHKYLLSFIQPAGCKLYIQSSTYIKIASTAYYSAPAQDTLIQKLLYADGTGSENITNVVAKSEATTTAYQIKDCMITDLTQMFGTTIADYLYTLETGQAGAGVAWFKKLFPKPYYAYNAGQLMSVKALKHITRGFNQWDEVTELGGIDASTGQNTSGSSSLRCKNYIQVVPSTSYYVAGLTGGNLRPIYYDADKNYISAGYWQGGTSNNPQTTPSNCHYMRFYLASAYGTTYNHDICINLHWDGERDGEYEAYKKNTYPLDSDLELRGIPKLDASNNLYYVGDEYESDGTVTRKYGIVDLGTLTWAHPSENRSRAYINGFNIPAANVPPNAIAAKYIGVAASGTLADGQFAIYTVGGQDSIIFYYDGVNEPSGYLVYELATPTTEEADPYQNPQIVDDFGTEEYVDAGVTASTPTRDVAIPVGHNTKYQPNLRAKLEMLPNSPDGDGDYLMRQSNGENSFVPFVKELPALPSEDGTYVLKCTVSGSTKTLGWVEEE